MNSQSSFDSLFPCMHCVIFFLWLFSKHSLYFIFISLYMMWLGLFVYLPWQIHWLSCMPFIKNRKLSAVLSSDILSVPLSPPCLELLFTFKLGHVLPVPHALFIRFQYCLLCILFILDTFYYYSFKCTKFLPPPFFC